MYLYRDGNNHGSVSPWPHNPRMNPVCSHSNGSGTERVEFHFHDLSRMDGLRPLKQSTFTVGADWDDVELLLQKFAEMEHPKALKLVRAMRLLEAVSSVMAEDDSSLLETLSDCFALHSTDATGTLK